MQALVWALGCVRLCLSERACSQVGRSGHVCVINLMYADISPCAGSQVHVQRDGAEYTCVFGRERIHAHIRVVRSQATLSALGIIHRLAHDDAGPCHRQGRLLSRAGMRRWANVDSCAAVIGDEFMAWAHA